MKKIKLISEEEISSQIKWIKIYIVMLYIDSMIFKFVMNHRFSTVNETFISIAGTIKHLIDIIELIIQRI